MNNKKIVENHATKVEAYKCPFCNRISLKKSEIEEHLKICFKNPNYVKKCINCSSLYKDFVLQNIRHKGICIYTCAGSSGCPYINHDDTEIQREIDKSRDEYVKFSKYDNSKSIEENWKREKKYDELRKNGYSVEEASSLSFE